MKKRIAAAAFLAIIIIVGCGPSVTFDEPQPAGVKALTFFPESLQGKYADTGHISTLIISADRIFRHYDFDLKQHKDSLGSSYQIVNDTLVNIDDGTKEKIILKSDTVIWHIDQTDTLLIISADNILKKFKGYYFLNSCYSENAWVVSKLSFNKEALTVSSIAGEDDLEKLEEISGTSTDTIPANLSLTKQQFKRFVKQNGFSDKERFVRIANTGR